MGLGYRPLLFQVFMESSQNRVSFLFLKFIHSLRERERERERVQVGGRQRLRKRENPKQALRCQHKARCGARTHEQSEHDLSRSETLHRLSHAGVPQKQVS